MGNNPKLGLVNVDVHTNFGQILSIHSQDIERKLKCSRNYRMKEPRKDRVNYLYDYMIILVTARSINPRPHHQAKEHLLSLRA